MRQSRTLFLYLVREILLYGTLAFAATVTVLMSHNLLRRLDDLMMVGFTGADLRTVLSWLLPMLAGYTLPIAFLIGTLLALRRMIADGELAAMRACGLGVRTVLAPILSIALLIAVYDAYLLGSVEHRAHREILRLFGTVAARGGMFEPGRFTNLRNGVLFVDSRDRDGTLHRVMIHDGSDPKRRYHIFAETGTFAFDEKSHRIRLHLKNGAVFLDPPADEPERSQRIHFEDFAYLVDVSAHLRGAGRAVRPKQMTEAELRAVVARAERGEDLIGLDERNPVAYELEIQRRLAMPIAPVVFALLAVPFGVSSSRRRNDLGLVLCVVCVFVYYAAFFLFQALARDGLVSAGLAFWTPNAIFLAAGLALTAVQSRSVPR